MLSRLVVFVLLSVYGVSAQLSNVTCAAGTEWSYNSRGQTPCTIAAYLDSACLPDPSGAFIQPLTPGDHYVLTAAAASDCFCNTVFYSIISACANCQNDESLPWTTWATNCTNVFVEEFPRPIPPGTSVPAWAYMDVTTSNQWTPTAAQAFKANNGSEFSNTASSSSASSSSPTGGSSPSATSAAPSGSSKKTDVGAIVGGVVGGVGGVAIVAFLLWFWMSRRQRGPTPAQYRAPSPTLHATTPDTEKQPHYAQMSVTPALPVSPPVSPMTVTSGRLYNPDDPSTFPDAQPPNTVYSQPQRGSAVFSAQNGYQPAGIHYSGVAEV